jgi:hypothetical protein
MDDEAIVCRTLTLAQRSDNPAAAADSGAFLTPAVRLAFWAIEPLRQEGTVL